VALGDPLIPNATISVSRAGVATGPASINASITLGKDIGFIDAGAAQRRILLVSLQTNIQPVDDVTILSINNLPPRKPGPYEVEDAIEDGGGPELGLLMVFLIGF
jgi:hypothetical protein